MLDAPVLSVRDLAERAARAAPPHTYLGGTSFNEHGVPPAQSLEELRRSTPAEPVAAVVHDPVLEAAGVFSSHTMVRLPLVDEGDDGGRDRSASADAARRSVIAPGVGTAVRLVLTAVALALGLPLHRRTMQVAGAVLAVATWTAVRLWC